MTHEENLDTILQEFRERLSRHHPEGIWDKIAKKTTGGIAHSSAFQIYISQLKKEGYIEQIQGETDFVASLKGLTFEGFVKQQNNNAER